MYAEGSDKNFINVTSLARKSFEMLLEIFAPHYDQAGKWRPGGNGRPRELIYTHAVLGLLLSFNTDSCGMKSLCLQFGIPPSTCSRTLKKAELCLAICLHVSPVADIK